MSLVNHKILIFQETHSSKHKLIEFALGSLFATTIPLNGFNDIIKIMCVFVGAQQIGLIQSNPLTMLSVGFDPNHFS